MTLPIDDSQWQLRINTTFDNQNKQYSLGLFNNPLVAIKVTSADALPTWRKGGSVSQSLVLNGTKTAFTAQQELTLDKLSVYEFPYPTEAEYELVYFTLFRLPQVKIEVWEYTGEVKNALAEKIITAFESQSIISTQLTPESSSQILTLSQKIDNLMALFSSNPITVPSLPQKPSNTCTSSNYVVLNEVQPVVYVNQERQGLILHNQNENEEILIGFPHLNNLPNDWFIKIPPQSFYEFPMPFAGELVAYSENPSPGSMLYVYEFFYQEMP